MKQVVWKFELRPWSAFIDMPRGARILRAGVDGTNTACVWALCNPDASKEPRYVVAVPTGGDVPRHATEYVDTFPLVEGGGFFVFHVFEGPAKTENGVTEAVGAGFEGTER